MKHPVTATAHRIIEAFWCCTCVPEWGAGVSRIVLYGSMWHMLLKLLLYFRLQVRNFSPPPPFPLTYSRNQRKSVRKSSQLCHRTYPNGLREIPLGSYVPSFRGFLHNLVGTGRGEPWERGCFLQVFWLL